MCLLALGVHIIGVGGGLTQVDVRGVRAPLGKGALTEPQLRGYDKQELP
jgi:hypothetical protein